MNIIITVDGCLLYAELAISDLVYRHDKKIYSQILLDEFNFRVENEIIKD